MENKLTIKELAPYLPYKLNGKYTLSDVINLSKGQKDEVRDNTLINDNVVFFLVFCKPLLRPLCDLTREIEHNGEKFVPMKIIDKIRKDVSVYEPLNSNSPLELIISTENYSQEIELMDGYLIMQKLIEWHFDVFRLIEKGLALPKK